MKKRVKVVMLPNESILDRNQSPIFADSLENGKLVFNDTSGSTLDVEYKDCESYNLYLVLDEDVKIGEPYYYNYYTDEHEVGIATKDITERKDDADTYTYKIIATTDDEFEELPQIPKSFIKAYVKAGGKIDEVLVEFEKSGACECAYFVEPGGDFKNCGKCPEDKYVPKLRDDNTVIIHQAKTFSKEEVLQILKDYDREFKLDTVSYTKPCSFTVDDWAEKNL